MSARVHRTANDDKRTKALQEALPFVPLDLCLLVAGYSVFSAVHHKTLSFPKLSRVTCDGKHFYGLLDDGFFRSITILNLDGAEISRLQIPNVVCDDIASDGDGLIYLLTLDGGDPPHKVRVYTHAGRLIRMWTAIANYSMLTYDRKHHLVYVTSSFHDGLYRFTPNGDPLGFLPAPRLSGRELLTSATLCICPCEDNRVYVACRYGKAAYSHTKDGNDVKIVQFDQNHDRIYTPLRGMCLGEGAMYVFYDTVIECRTVDGHFVQMWSHSETESLVCPANDHLFWMDQLMYVVNLHNQTIIILC